MIALDSVWVHMAAFVTMATVSLEEHTSEFSLSVHTRQCVCASGTAVFVPWAQLCLSVCVLDQGSVLMDVLCLSGCLC